MRRIASKFLVSLMVLVLPLQSVKADAIVVPNAMKATTIAEIFITDKAVRIELEIGTRDLPAFRNLLPRDLYSKLKFPPKPHQKRIQRFFAEDLTVRTDQGGPTAGTVERTVLRPRVRRDRITGKPLPTQNNDPEIVVFAELKYPLTGKPRLLSLSPPGSQGKESARANIGFVAYHAGLPVNDFRYLAAEETLDLDWEDPWYSRFRNRNLKRQYDAPLSAFLYVEHSEIRKEIIVRPMDLQHCIDLGLQGKKSIRAIDKARLKKRVADFLQTKNPVKVDGQVVEGTLDRIHFIRRSLRRTLVVEPDEDLDITSATLGVIVVYPIEGLPREVTMRWDLFTPRIQKVPAVATDEAGGLPTTLTPQDNVLRWRNFLTNPSVPAMREIPAPETRSSLRLPVVSLFCASLFLVLLGVAIVGGIRHREWPWKPVVASMLLLGCGALTMDFATVTIANPFARASQLTQDQARAIVEDLLHNVYRAFDRREESLVYDRLAQSITGDLLTDAYLQIRKSMELESQGGAQVKVDEVKVLGITPQASNGKDGFAYRCRWIVSGSVGHWGHVHRRINQYEALITIKPDQGSWKMTTMELLGETRIDNSRSQ